MGMLAIIAIGGNSLIRNKDHQTVKDQYEAVRETSGHIVDMIKEGYDVVITHGNGPQVGFILRRSELAHELAGMHIVTLVEVDRDDPAFSNPTKPIGSFFTEEQIGTIRKEHPGWHIVYDAGRGYRRVVPSPIPRKIIESRAIEILLRQGFCVVGAGGGGIPVYRNEQGEIEGIDAVIDKDIASSLLASQLKADLFVISTAVEKVYLNYGKPNQTPLDRVTVEQVRQYMEEGHFAVGSMLPKIRAALEFLTQGGKEAIITTPDSLTRAVRGKSGTHIYPS
jgi:carbamate kinase